MTGQTSSSVKGTTPKRTGILVNSVHDHLKREILAGALKPGVKLTHQGIAEALDVSRTPVREALERLYQEGLLIRELRRGYFVGEIGSNDAVELYGAREALELYTLGIVLDRGVTATEIARLKAINRRYEGLIKRDLTHERLMVDREFHVELAGLSGNGFVKRMLDSIFERVILKRRLERVTDTRGDEPYREHIQLLDALTAGDRARATTVLRTHIRGACDRLLKHLRSFGAASPVAPGRRTRRAKA